MRKIPTGTVHRTIGLLDGALRALGAEADDTVVEQIGVMINRAMSAQQRSFHTPEHIFDLSDPSDPHSTLAALFHDLVYYQVDHGFLPEIGDLLSPYVDIAEGAVSIRPDVRRDDRAFWGCAAVFGFTPGMVLSPFGGLNEFLSALVMDVLLEGIVTDLDLLVATACIEATIPFRAPNAEGKRPPELLADRLRTVNEQFGLGLSEQRITQTVIDAICFANRDVRNFAESDVGRFLDNTWKLLPESNPELRLGGLYSISSYSHALLKMEGFMSSLRTDTIFHRYADWPEQSEFDELNRLAERNLRTARRYLRIKLLTAVILEALAEETGGDAPVAYFMGDIRPEEQSSQLANHLPASPQGCGRSDEDADSLFALLAHGRTSDSRFDLKNSPLSLFVYRCISDDQIDSGVVAAREYLSGTRSALDFLATLPAQTVADIARAAGQMAFTRTDALEAIAARLQR